MLTVTHIRGRRVLENVPGANVRPYGPWPMVAEEGIPVIDVRQQESAGVLDVVMDRPPVNAVSLEVQQELIETFESVAGRED